jgi:AraC family transcriptional regulator of adaptative response/methylated-DNA-[protein]-cysteine methyltransferase
MKIVPSAIVNEASLDDVDVLTRLLVTLFTQEREFVPEPARQRMGLERIFANPELGQILVARVKGKVVGMVSLLYSLSTALGGKVATLEDWVVEPAFRNRGVGSLLLRQAIVTAKNHVCLRITLLTDYDNELAQKLYQREGFVKSSMNVFRLGINR